METVRIGVIVRDRHFRNALLRALSHESRDFQFISLNGYDDPLFRSCQIILADSAERTAERHEAALMLKEETAYPGSRDDRTMKPAVISLTYHEIYDFGDRGNDLEIFRYEDARIFVNKIIYYYSRIKGIDLYFHGKKKCRKVVFSSVCGGCGTTSAAMTSARFLKYRFGKRTLFMSLCPLDGSRRFTGSGDAGNMMSLLYHLHAGDDVPLCKFISSSEGVDHFRGETNNRAASEMNVSDLKRLIKLIDDMGDYDYVIFDVGDHLGTLAQFLMDGADVVVTVKQKDYMEKCVHGPDAAVKHGMKINVVDFDGICDENAREEDKVYLTYDPDAFVCDEERTYIDIRGQYGRDVSRLAEKIIGCADEW